MVTCLCVFIRREITLQIFFYFKNKRGDFMKKKQDRRTRENRRESSEGTMEEYIKYFIPKDEEQRKEKDRRKADPDTK